METQHKSLDELIQEDRRGGFRGRGARGGFRGRRGGFRGSRGGFRGRGGQGNRGRSQSENTGQNGAQRALNVGRIKNRGAAIFKKRDGGRPNQGNLPQGQGQRQQNNQNNGNNNQSRNNQSNDKDRQQIRRRLAQIRERQDRRDNSTKRQENRDKKPTQSQNTGNQNTNQNNQNRPHKQAQSPVQAKKGTGPNGNNRRVGGKTLKLVQGSIAQRKIRVTNIDAKTVTNADLNVSFIEIYMLRQKLFGKCGPMIQARFDTNEQGQYLGTATVIYAKAGAAQRAINDYNGASLDNRMMKVALADEQATRNSSQQKPNHNRPGSDAAQLRRQERRLKSLNARRGNNRIQKNREIPRASENRDRKPLIGDENRDRIERRRAIRDKRRQNARR